jgi:4-alpha-glucanotransferase
VRDNRVGGLLLHPTSLPSRFGIGDLGPEAYRFVDFLAGAGQRLWQVLPLGPTGFGDSPYQCFSAFAGNPLLVSLEGLARAGWLEAADLDAATRPEGDVDYGVVIATKLPMLSRAYERFEARASAAQRAGFEHFCHANAAWLDDFALYMAIKDAHHGAVWTAWEKGIATRESRAVSRWRARCASEVAARKFVQWQFFEQWAALHAYCRERRVQVMGDIPIFVSHDSADVWAHHELFHLDKIGKPTVVAGVPPDYFSATGQLWGNPLYRWDKLASTGYAWWIDRVRATFALVDRLRIDHFRGFEAYWEVPAEAKTAVDGRWVKGPGAAFFEALRAAVGALPIVAENLGVITPEVEALRERFSFPGMAILQFAFASEVDESTFQPHNFVHNLVAYTGTHDNDTTLGWWMGGVGHTTRKPDEVEHERAFAKKYMATDGWEIHWACIRTLWASVADTVVVPLQDVLGLGSDARMNLPGRADGNWRWRYHSGALTDHIRGRLLDLTKTYGRARTVKK